MSLAARAEVQESHAREPYPVHARPGQTLREALNAALPDTPQRGAMAGPSGGLMSWGLRPLSGGRFMVSFAESMPAPMAPRTPQSGDAAAAQADEPARQLAAG